MLFAIDVSKSMIEPPSESDTNKRDVDSPSSAALKCAYAFIQQRIISSPHDMVGILLFGTEKSKFLNSDSSISGREHLYLLTDLCIPSAEDVLELRGLIEDEQQLSKLMAPADDRVSLSNMLFAANQIFAERAANFASRRLFIVTDNDDPHEEKAAKEAAAIRAKDLYDLGSMIELFPVTKPGVKFNKSKFYDVRFHWSDLLSFIGADHIEHHLQLLPYGPRGKCATCRSNKGIIKG